MDGCPNRCWLAGPPLCPATQELTMRSAIRDWPFLSETSCLSNDSLPLSFLTDTHIFPRLFTVAQATPSSYWSRPLAGPVRKQIKKETRRGLSRGLSRTRHRTEVEVQDRCIHNFWTESDFWTAQHRISHELLAFRSHVLQSQRHSETLLCWRPEAPRTLEDPGRVRQRRSESRTRGRRSRRPAARS